MKVTNSYKVYDGPSLINGERIFVAVTGIKKPSNTAKTGPLAQAFILAYDEPPHEAIKSGKDAAVCGDCPLRPITMKLRRAGKIKDGLEHLKPCYVKTFHAPLATWKCNKDKPVTDPATIHDLLRADLREGAYGDPGAVPIEVWEALRPRPKRGNSYTHQWKRAQLQARAMASTDTSAELREAEALGYRSFRTVPKSVFNVLGDAALDPNEIWCPNQTDGIQCIKCMRCNGKKGQHDNRPSNAIVAH